MSELATHGTRVCMALALLSEGVLTEDTKGPYLAGFMAGLRVACSAPEWASYTNRALFAPIKGEPVILAAEERANALAEQLVILCPIEAVETS